MQITDDEKKEIRNEMLVNGYTEYETDYFDSASYERLRSTMLEYLPENNEKKFTFDFLPKSEILAAGRFVIDKHFGTIDLRVPFANGDEMETRLVALFGEKPTPEQYDDIIDYINNQIDLVRVTDIPVSINTNRPRNGYVETTCFYEDEIEAEEYYKRLPACVREIGIEGPCDEESKCTYVHEMTHALVNRRKGNVRSLLNNELLSIFLETVAARDVDQSGELLDLENYFRILYNKYCMLDSEMVKYRGEGFERLLSDKKYIISTLHATALFNTYARGTNKTRDEIDKAIGRVFTGDEVLEDMLDHYEASLERGAKIMQKQIKKYHEKFFDK